MVLILLLLLYNHDNLILKLHQKKNSYLDEGWLFIGSFKVGSVPGMVNKEILAQFIYVSLHNQLKNCLYRKIRKNYYTLCILKKEDE